MLAWATSFVAGYASRTSCAELAPCRSAGLALGGRPFKLSFCIHSANFEDLGDASSRPFVCVSVGDRTKRTELGDMSQDGKEWRFREALTLEVWPREEVVVSVHFTQQYDLVVAALALSSKLVGEACFPVSMVLPKLNMEDRDIDGMLYVTPRVSFDLISGGAKRGRALVSVETKQPPAALQSARGAASDAWCNLGTP